ncbi:MULTISPECIES: hypothetical protein [unclassified Streptomyces]|uniref:hypothetical protein n=1 Tax=unclassified Streptomyces TaxID=2593676 RepID=UPI003418D926
MRATGDPQFTMRPATLDDNPRLGSLIQKREVWMRAGGFPGHRELIHVLSSVGSTGTEVMVLEEPVEGKEAVLLGCTVLKHAVSATSGWEPAERTERAMAMVWTYSHPALRYRQDRLGQLMTWWVADYVARRYADVDWIRSTVRSPALLKLARDRDGWREVRQVRDATYARVHLLQREPRPMDGLRALIGSPPELFADSVVTSRANTVGLRIVPNPT